MTSLNKVQLIGNLGRDPEVRYSADGNAIANISIATTEVWKDKSTGDKKEATEWHRIVFFNRLAEIVGEYLKKGSQVYIEGQLRTRKWTDREGHDRYTTEIIANEMKILGPRNLSSSNQSYNPSSRVSSEAPSKAPAPEKKDAASDDFHDDVPF